jgi:hypothetical protein
VGGGRPYVAARVREGIEGGGGPGTVGRSWAVAMGQPKVHSANFDLNKDF